MVCVTQFTALEVIRYVRLANGNFADVETCKINSTSSLSEIMKANSNLQSSINSAYSNKPYIGYFGSSQNKHIKAVRFSKLLTNKASLYCVPNTVNCDFSNIVLPKPELLFISLASALSFHDLLLLGFELCGNYVMQDGGYEQVSHTACTIEKITKAINYFKKSRMRTPGLPAAAKACKLIANNSASPQETNLFLKLTLPKTLGGFGVNCLSLNEQISLTETAQQISNKSYVIADLCSAKNHVIVEYDSRQFHSEVDKNQMDKRRRDALVHDGWHVFTFVPAMVKSTETFNCVATDIAKLCHMDTRIRVKNFYDKQFFLFSKLDNNYTISI